MVKIPFNTRYDEVHLPQSKWTKGRILDQIGGNFIPLWETWTIDDLINTVMVNDGYQWGGEQKGHHGGYCQLLCVNRSVIEKIEDGWRDIE